MPTSSSRPAPTWVGAIHRRSDRLSHAPQRRSRPPCSHAAAEVAHTIAFRRRKGTVVGARTAGAGRHRLARARGCGVFSDLRGPRKYMNHIRRQHHLRAGDATLGGNSPRIGTAFDSTAHRHRCAPRSPPERSRHNTATSGCSCGRFDEGWLAVAARRLSRALNCTDRRFRFQSARHRTRQLFTKPGARGRGHALDYLTTPAACARASNHTAGEVDAFARSRSTTASP